MSRRTRRKYYKRKSGRWSANIVKIGSNLIAPVGEWFAYEDLALNPVQASTGITQTYTAKNFEITFTLEPVTSNAADTIEGVTAYIMYVPQGMEITSSYYAQHPEYIMAYKYIGSPAGYTQISGNAQESQQYQPHRIKTRLSRKLQTGDKIVLYIQGSNEALSDRTVALAGIVRWWTKAN